MTEDVPVTRRLLREREEAARRAKPVAPAPAAFTTPTKKTPVGKRILSGAALLFAGALVVGMSVPANAFFSDAQAPKQAVSSVNGQTIDVSTTAADTGTDRAIFKITTVTEQLIQKYSSGSKLYSPTAGPVRWPFPYVSPITDGFGMRVAPCRGCSTFHKGIDFTPGEGKPTFAIAAGVVESSVVSNAGLGNEVIINHVIKGQQIQSVYGHLEMNSSPLKAGDTVKVGDLVGLVGSTGTTTGSNMHLEVHVNGVPVDPFAWLTANAK